MDATERNRLLGGLKSIAPTIPGRESQARFLLSFLSGNHTNPLFISGPPSTGKTLVVNRILSLYPNIPTAHLDCIELCTDRLLFRAALRILIAKQYNKPTSRPPPLPTSGLSSYITTLSSLPKQSIIVLDRVERLTTSNFSPNLPEVLFRLGELTNNVKLILISSLPYSIFSQQNNHLDIDEPLQLHFPDYPLKTLHKILSIHHNPNPSNSHDTKQNYHQFLKTILETTTPITTDIKILHRTSHHLYKTYLLPLTENPSLTPAQLYNRITNQLTNIPNTLFNHTQNSPATPTKTPLSLPTTTKRLLLASYLASRNPPSQDLRHFTPHKSRRTKARKRRRRDDNYEEDEGKSFVMERLLAIYCAIGDGGDGEEVMGGGGVSMAVVRGLGVLEALGVLEREGWGVEGKWKWGGWGGVEEVKGVARSLGIDIDGYLYQG